MAELSVEDDRILKEGDQPGEREALGIIGEEERILADVAEAGHGDPDSALGIIAGAIKPEEKSTELPAQPEIEQEPLFPGIDDYDRALGLLDEHSSDITSVSQWRRLMIRAGVSEAAANKIFASYQRFKEGVHSKVAEDLLPEEKRGLEALSFRQISSPFSNDGETLLAFSRDRICQEKYERFVKPIFLDFVRARNELLDRLGLSRYRIQLEEDKVICGTGEEVKRRYGKKGSCVDYDRRFLRVIRIDGYNPIAIAQRRYHEELHAQTFKRGLETGNLRGSWRTEGAGYSETFTECLTRQELRGYLRSHNEVYLPRYSNEYTDGAMELTDVRNDLAKAIGEEDADKLLNEAFLTMDFSLFTDAYDRQFGEDAFYQRMRAYSDLNYKFG